MTALFAALALDELLFTRKPWRQGLRRRNEYCAKKRELPF